MRLLYVEYRNGKQIESIEITDMNLEGFKRDMDKRGWEILAITEKIVEKDGKEPDKDEIEKRKFHNTKYACEIQKLNKGKITSKEFRSRVKLLDELHKNCKTSNEMKIIYKYCVQYRML